MFNTNAAIFNTAILLILFGGVVHLYLYVWSGLKLQKFNQFYEEKLPVALKDKFGPFSHSRQVNQMMSGHERGKYEETTAIAALESTFKREQEL